MAKIHTMSKELAMLVAAGEVVERPGSVVKELMENAIDAGASKVSVEIKNGGSSYIRVTDNGEGIEPEDVPVAFLRHATSKISSPQDLIAVRTLGFRGEALAAIAAVSRIDMFTRRRENALGVHYCIEGGEEKSCEETGCPAGTTIVIRDLFYNVPARMKFLKKDATEASVVEGLVTNIAFSHPEIAFVLTKDGKESFSTPGDGRPATVLRAICGADIAKSFLRIDGDFGIAHISGFVSPPDVCRSNRGYENFYVNGRYARTASMLKAVDAAYKSRITPGKFPMVFLNVDINPILVDVNVHPAKTEIKLSREKEVLSAIYDAVCIALEGDRIPDYSADSPFSRKEEDAEKDEPLRERAQKSPVYTGFVYNGPESNPKTSISSPRYSYNARPAYPGSDTWKIARAVKQQTDRASQVSFFPESSASDEDIPVIQGSPLHPATVPLPNADEVRYVGEIFTTYILMADKNGFWIMDKHAAHERILYQQLLEQGTSADHTEQILMEPVTVFINSAEKERLLGASDALSSIGFTVEDGGSAGLRVIAAPSMIKPEDYADALSDVADKLIYSSAPVTERMDAVLKSMACKAAIKAGKPTTPEEMTGFIKRVLSIPGPKTCPHGRPYIFHVGKEQFDRLFKRS